MTRKEILVKLRHVMKQASQEHIDWNTVIEDATIESLGFDSLSMLDLIYDIQQEFDIEFEAEELVSINRVSEMVTFLEKNTSP